MRTVKKIMPSQKVNMGGIILDQPLPQSGVNQIDPFLLVHHWDQKFKGGDLQKNVGVGPHPHRGFSPVTFIFKGGVHHRDSTGKNSIIDAGGTQWMNSGSGIVHSERPRKDIAEKGGDFELIQFWVNTPSEKKMNPPSYQPLKAEETPWITSEDGKTKVGVVSGELNKVKGKINSSSPLITLRIEMSAGGSFKFKLPKEYNTFIYQMDGDLTVNDQDEAEGRNLIWFNNDGEELEIASKNGSRFILLSGEPIKESIATYGPFVMNNNREIMEALNDYQSGKMGQLDEVFE